MRRPRPRPYARIRARPASLPRGRPSHPDDEGHHEPSSLAPSSYTPRPPTPRGRQVYPAVRRTYFFMARRLVLCLVCSLVLAAPAAGGDIYHHKRAIDERISTVNQKLAHARVQAGVLTAQISVATTEIRAFQNDVVQAQAKLNMLESQLATHQRKLDKLNALFVLQTKKLDMLRSAYYVALKRFERRLIDSYETPNVDAVDVMLSATSMSNLLDEIEY